MKTKLLELWNNKRTLCIISGCIAIVLITVVIVLCVINSKKEVAADSFVSTSEKTTTIVSETTTITETTTEKITEAPTQTADQTTKAKITTTKGTTPKSSPMEAQKPDSDSKPVITLTTQNFPIKFTSYGKQFEITSASIKNIKSSGEFELEATVLRCDDGIEGKGNGSFRVLIKDSQGNVQKTSMGVGLLEIGQSDLGLSTFGVRDGTVGPYTVELVQI